MAKGKVIKNHILPITFRILACLGLVFTLWSFIVAATHAPGHFTSGQWCAIIVLFLSSLFFLGFSYVVEAAILHIKKR